VNPSCAGRSRKAGDGRPRRYAHPVEITAYEDLPTQRLVWQAGLATRLGGAAPEQAGLSILVPVSQVTRVRVSAWG
ncbi:MAG: hypothetical protein ACYS19_15865, partial [Planctomycetota bacterium]